MSEVDKPGLRWFLTDASPREAQLAPSYLVWPAEVPDPRVVDEWIQRQGRAPLMPQTRSEGVGGIPHGH
jgi:hypothetical protein